jgi:hypothetical protein
MGRGTDDLMEVTLFLTFNEEFKQRLGVHPDSHSTPRRETESGCFRLAGTRQITHPDGPAGGVGAPSTGISVFLTKLRSETCQIRSPFSPLLSLGCPLQRGSETGKGERWKREGTHSDLGPEEDALRCLAGGVHAHFWTL